MANNHEALAYPHKSDIYTYRVPTPPRIVVPPPALDSNSIPDIHFTAREDARYTFLQAIDYSNLVQHNAPLEWAYERRREAQAILPFLSLGPMTAAKDEARLARDGTTMLLGVRQQYSFESKLMTSALRVAEKLGLEYHTVDLATNQDLIHSFPHTTALINAHLARIWNTQGGRLGKVLVFCESGNERSAGVVAAYLMETHQDVDYIKAMQLCQAQRFCINFDDGMKRLLQGYWDILVARRDTAAGAGPLGKPVGGTLPADPSGPGLLAAPARGKRSHERYEDDDEEMEVDDDEERFSGRSFAPFIDESSIGTGLDQAQIDCILEAAGT